MNRPSPDLPEFLDNKKETAKYYRDFFKTTSFEFVDTPNDCSSSFWLNAVLLKDKVERNNFLKITNEAGVMTRPVWRLMSELPPFMDCQKTELVNARYYDERIVNIPSSVRV